MIQVPIQLPDDTIYVTMHRVPNKGETVVVGVASYRVVDVVWRVAKGAASPTVFLENP